LLVGIIAKFSPKFWWLTSNAFGVTTYLNLLLKLFQKIVLLKVSISSRRQGWNCNFEYAREYLRLIFIQIR
jgi:hypothetical protein